MQFCPPLGQNARMADDLKKRIETRLGVMGRSARAISISAGLGPDAIRNVLRERSKYPRGDTLRDLARALDCSIDWLMCGKDSPAAEAMGKEKAAEGADAGKDAGDAPSGTFALLPVLRPWAEKGDPAQAHGQPATLYHQPVHRSWLMRLTHADTDTLGLVEIGDDTMLPTLRPGDHVLTDLSRTNFYTDGIYVLNNAGCFPVKRLAMLPDKARIRVGADNPEYPSFDDVDPAGLRIFGQVIWIGRRLR